LYCHIRSCLAIILESEIYLLIGLVHASFIMYRRASKSCIIEPRSSRLKDKTRNEGEVIVKETFVKSVLQNNNLISMLVDRGGSCVILPHGFSSGSHCSKSDVSRKITMQATGDHLGLDRRPVIRHLVGSSLVYPSTLSLSLSLSLSLLYTVYCHFYL
jgi:hypothetical protein